MVRNHRLADQAGAPDGQLIRQPVTQISYGAVPVDHLLHRWRYEHGELLRTRRPVAQIGAIGLGKQLNDGARDDVEHIVAEQRGQFDQLVGPEKMLA